ncbi:phage holin [Latilactobacillus curvatus]|uniref:Holin n=1 Tax=Latilactobacillus curvatus TaxID=28038 RepID=A0ABM7QSA4_LATCU|nr:phage holin [Latilactobacillus curvatus]UTC12356.1 phage holin [Latilactobacillus curvatus]BCX29452.1 holin [Latilactobacillus curvatus]
MKINWKVRVKNKMFWVAVVPAALLLIQVTLVPFGYRFEIEPLNSQLLAIVNAVFALLTILGVVNDPTTNGTADSTNALNYEAPRKDVK